MNGFPSADTIAQNGFNSLLVNVRDGINEAVDKGHKHVLSPVLPDALKEFLEERGFRVLQGTYISIIEWDVKGKVQENVIAQYDAQRQAHAQAQARAEAQAQATKKLELEPAAAE